MRYIVSQELLDIFTKNGLQDFTEKWEPKHFREAIEAGVYKSNMKRCIGATKADYVCFDYINLKCWFEGGLCGEGTSFNDDEVRSIVAFYTLPTYTRRALLNQTSQTIPCLHQFYQEIKSEPRWHTGKTIQRFCKAFETVSLS